jgi:nucleoside-diphosphate-sugar epimerase
MGQLLIDYAHRRLGAYVPGGFEFVAARDIVEGHLLAMNKGRTGQKYIFSTEFMTIETLFELFRDVTGQPKLRLCLPPAIMTGVAEVGDFVYCHFLPGRRQLLTPAAVRLLCMGRRADTGKAQRELGYRPGSIREAVQEAYDWFVARGIIERPRSIALGRRPNADARAGAKSRSP